MSSRATLNIPRFEIGFPNAGLVWLRALLAAALFAVLLAFAAPSIACAEEDGGNEQASTEDVSEQASTEDASEQASEASSTATSVDDDSANLVDPTQRADNSFIYDTTIATLLEQSTLYDERTVQVVGEVIGDCISESNGRSWIMITETNEDDPASISVLMSEEQANQIDHFGRYGVVGTTLQVRGTYHQACSEHDGQPDIHATNSSVLSHGVEHPDEFNPNDFFPGAIAIIIGILMMGGFYFVRERTR